MKIKHSCVTSSIYQFEKKIEFDVELGDDGFTVIIEVFKNMSVPNSYRANIFRTELFRIQSTFPQDNSTSQPLDEPSDEDILIGQHM